jgi:hypothetical protein
MQSIACGDLMCSDLVLPPTFEKGSWNSSQLLLSLAWQLPNEEITLIWLIYEGLPEALNPRSVLGNLGPPDTVSIANLGPLLYGVRMTYLSTHTTVDVIVKATELPDLCLNQDEIQEMHILLYSPTADPLDYLPDTQLMRATEYWTGLDQASFLAKAMTANGCVQITRF